MIKKTNKEEILIKDKTTLNYVRGLFRMEGDDFYVAFNIKIKQVLIYEKNDSVDNFKIAYKFPVVDSAYDRKAGTAVAPAKMIDKYKEKKCFIALNHSILTMAGLKILMKELGLSVRVTNSNKKNLNSTSIWGSRFEFRIFPKTEGDYALFYTFFSDDIGSEIKHYPHILMGSGTLKPMVRKRKKK